MDKINWGGSGIEKVVFDFIRENVKSGSSVLELGAGYVSTKALMPYYKLTTVEHDINFKNINPNTIYAPINNGWYDTAVLDKSLAAHYDLLIIDGADRLQVLNNLHYFEKCDKIIIHDTYRDKEKQLATELKLRLNKNLEWFTNGDYWAYLW